MGPFPFALQNQSLHHRGHEGSRSLSSSDEGFNSLLAFTISAVSGTTTLYRPVGRKELDLIRAAGMKAFPPRLPEQPIFYPVLTLEYARKIARNWNTQDQQSGYAGFVLRFEVETLFLHQFQVQAVGGEAHQEYWIPADRLDELNRNILGDIQVVESYSGNPE